MNGNWVFPKNVLMRYILCVMNVNNLKDIYPQNNIRSQQPYLQCLSHAHKSTPLSTTRLSVFLPKSLTSADGRLIVHGLRVANIDMIMFVDSCLFFKLTLQKNGEQNEVSLELLVPKKKVPSISCFSNHRLTNPPPTWLLRKMLHSPLIRLVLLLRMIVFTISSF
ncbi:uncharacterized protein LOC111404011 [Olea europaea var. sylvestris]|uniref:uncharacterized protein LOC111404011 n=1 Tax=Olea europaea var. sylvestris TaxID=158386 RepID=UPI000C1D62A7|nr:uncharacterized protein LOC111404011 [Olea europaea var. sylvestris]